MTNTQYIYNNEREAKKKLGLDTNLGKYRRMGQYEHGRMLGKGCLAVLIYMMTGRGEM